MPYPVPCASASASWPPPLHPGGIYLPVSARELPVARATENSSRPGPSLMTELPRRERCDQCRGKQPSSAQKKRADLSRPAPGAAFPTNQRKSTNYERN